jgi:hypothetical protein
MNFLKTTNPVEDLHAHVAVNGNSERSGVFASRIIVSFDGAEDYDIPPEIVERVKSALNWEIEVEYKNQWNELLVNLRTPSKEKSAHFYTDMTRYQFFRTGSYLSLTASIQGLDVDDFEAEVATAQELLGRASRFADLAQDDITFVLGWAHLTWDSLSKRGDVEERLVEF